MTLGEKVQDLRRRKAMSQDDLAEKLKVSRQAVSKWERDEATPETDKIILLAELFGVSTDYFLMGQSPRAEPERPVPQAPSVINRVEQFIRRHGYKAGYAMIAWGAVVCVIALLVMTLFPNISVGFGLHQPGTDTDLYGSLADAYYQDVNRIQTAFAQGVRTVTTMAGIPMALIGIALITFGIIVVVKGKKIAVSAQ